MLGWILTIIFVSQVDVIDHVGVDPQKPFDEFVVDGGRVEHAQVQDCLPHCPHVGKVPELVAVGLVVCH